MIGMIVKNKNMKFVLVAIMVLKIFRMRTLSRSVYNKSLELTVESRGASDRPE